MRPDYASNSMAEPITVLWLIEAREVPALRGERFRHVSAQRTTSASSIAAALHGGAVLAIVPTEAEGERALAQGADEVLVVADIDVQQLVERVVARTTARARARLHRDLYLVDLVRTDDTTALELLAAALGQELTEPLSRAAEETAELTNQPDAAGALMRQANSILDAVTSASQVVAQMRELLVTEPTDEVVDLAAVARDVVKALAPGFPRSLGVELAITTERCIVGLPRWQVAMLVARLIGNALESAALRGGEDRRISIGVSVIERAVVFEVTDDGVGMAEDERAHAADPFFTTSGGRVGLGLTLVSARVRRAGGSVLIESDPGEGTTVRVFLPLTESAPSSAVLN